MPISVGPIFEKDVTKPPPLPIAGLKATLAGIETELGKHQHWADYHQDELMKENTIVASLTEQVEALRSTIALLEKV